MKENTPHISTEHAEDAGSQRASPGRTGLLAAGGLLAALGVGSCCVVPVLLMSVGLGGAWLGNLFALSVYQPLFIALSIGCLGAGFYSVYRKPRASCDTASACSAAASNLAVKSVLWVATLLVLAGIAFPYVGTFLLET